MQIEAPGGGTEKDARMIVPEITHEYPENDRFGKTLPAYGMYFRHVKGLKLQNIDIRPLQPDAREMLVFDVRILSISTKKVNNPCILVFNVDFSQKKGYDLS